MASKAAIQCLFALVLAGCDSLGIRESELMIDVGRRRDDYVFSFSDCSTGTTYRPTHIEVAELNGARTPVCRSRASRLLSTPWRYGDGFSVDECRSLTRGHAYRLKTMGGGGGYVDFKLQADGDVEVLLQSCKRK